MNILVLNGSAVSKTLAMIIGVMFGRLVLHYKTERTDTND